MPEIYQAALPKHDRPQTLVQSLAAFPESACVSDPGGYGRACLDACILIGVLGRSRQTPCPLEISNRQKGLKARLAKRVSETDLLCAHFAWRLRNGRGNERDQGDSHLVFHRGKYPNDEDSLGLPAALDIDGNHRACDLLHKRSDNLVRPNCVPYPP